MNELQTTNTATIKTYFEKVCQLALSGELFPINLDEVWPLVYSSKGKAVRVLKKDYFEGEDYIVFAQNGKNSNDSLLAQNGKQRGGHNEMVYLISVSCMEHLVARKVREVFNVYREVFHRVINQPQKSVGPTLEQVQLQQAHMLIDQQQQINQLRAEVDSINARRNLPRPSEAKRPHLPRPEVDLRRALNNKVNEYCGTHGYLQSDTYSYLYKRMQQVYGIDVRRLGKAPSESYIDAIERYGHLDKLYSLVVAELNYIDE